jgi:hypothetical protein
MPAHNATQNINDSQSNWGSTAATFPDGITVSGTSALSGATNLSGTTTFTGSVVRASVVKQISSRAKVGASAGWAIPTTTDNCILATMAASQTAGTLVLTIPELIIGHTITGFTINAQVESAGNIVTIDGDLRAITNVAADVSDASIATMTQVSVTADTAVSQAKTGIAEVVTAGKSYYILVTGTTNANTDIVLLNPTITVTTA